MRAGIMAERRQSIVDLFLDPNAGELIVELLDMIDYNIDMDRLHAVQVRRALNRRRPPLGVLFDNNRVVSDVHEPSLIVPGPLRRQAASGERYAFYGSGTVDDPIDLS